MNGNVVLGSTLLVLLAAQAGASHVGCYYASWAYTRPGMGEFWPEDIDTSLCDVIYYGFANILNDTFEVCSWDPWFDMSMQKDGGKTVIKNCIRERNGDAWPPGCLTQSGQEYCHHDGIRRTIALKAQNPNLKVLLSVGGWTAGGLAFSNMAQTPQTRKAFIDSVVTFLNYFGLDGMDLDWEFPGLDMLTLLPTDPNDIFHFTDLIRELRQAFNPHGYILTMASSPDPAKARNAYELGKVTPEFDWINVMSYDYGGLWDGFTGIDAPLFGKAVEGVPGHPHYDFNMYDTFMYYINNGSTANKLSMGIHTEAKGFTLDNPGASNSGIYCPASGSPNMTFSRQEGWLYYYEILQFFYNSTIEDPNWPDLLPGIHNWNIVRDGCYKSPYAYQGQYWMSWDDPESVDLKIRFANTLGLKGAFVWEVDSDNFMGEQGPTYEILHTIRDTLDGGRPLTNGEMLGTAADNTQCGQEEADMCNFVVSTSPGMGTTTAAQQTTTGGNQQCDDAGCTQDAIHNVPHPDNCRWYYHCTYHSDGTCTMDVFDCSPGFFDPINRSCNPTEEPGDEYLCV